MSDLELVDAGDYWDIPMGDAEISRLSFDWAVIILVSSVDRSFEVRIEQEFRVKEPGGPAVLVDPEGDPAQLASALSLIRRPVAYVHAFKFGALEIGLVDGAVLNVPASDDYEPWELTSPKGVRIVSTPGGELSVWPG